MTKNFKLVAKWMTRYIRDNKEDKTRSTLSNVQIAKYHFLYFLQMKPLGLLLRNAKNVALNPIALNKTKNVKFVNIKIQFTIVPYASSTWKGRKVNRGLIAKIESVIQTTFRVSLITLQALFADTRIEAWLNLYSTI